MATHEAPARLTLGPDDDGRRISADEFADAIFLEPWRYERADGRLIVMAPDAIEHDESSEPLRDHLGADRLAHPGIVQMVRSQAWVRVPDGMDRVGDIGVHLIRNPPEPVTVDRVPDLIFEIVSREARDRRRDYVERRDEYFKMSVREYVLVDRFQGRVTVLTHAPEGYRERLLGPSDAYTSPLLPGLAIPLAEVLGS